MSTVSRALSGGSSAGAARLEIDEPTAEWREIERVPEERLGRRDPVRAGVAFGAIAAIVATGLLASQAPGIIKNFTTPPSAPPSTTAVETTRPTAAPTPDARPSPTPFGGAPSVAYTVEGDSLTLIAMRCHATIGEVEHANPEFANQLTFAVGTRITCPGTTALVQGNHDGTQTGPQMASGPLADADHCRAYGWASDPNDRTRAVVVRILVDGKVVTWGPADQLRKDIARNVGGDGHSGFDVSLVGRVIPDVPHEIRVQAFHPPTQTWLDLNNTPLTLACSSATGVWPTPPTPAPSPSPPPTPTPPPSPSPTPPTPTPAPSPSPAPTPTPAPSLALVIVPPQLVVAGRFTLEVPADWHTRRALPYPNGDQTLVYAGSVSLPSECEETPEGALCHPWPIVTLDPEDWLMAVRKHAAPGSTPTPGGEPVSVAGAAGRRIDGPADEGCASIGGTRSIEIVLPPAAGTTTWYTVEACIAGVDSTVAEDVVDTIVGSMEVTSALP